MSVAKEVIRGRGEVAVESKRVSERAVVEEKEWQWKRESVSGKGGVAVQDELWHWNIKSGSSRKGSGAVEEEEWHWKRKWASERLAVE